MGLIRRLAYDLRARAIDSLIHPLVAPFRSSAYFVMSIASRPIVRGSSFALLCRSHRILMGAGRLGPLSAGLNAMIEWTLRRACATGGIVEVAAAQARVREFDPALARKAGIVLKAPRSGSARVVERGALLLKYTESLDSFRRCAEISFGQRRPCRVGKGMAGRHGRARSAT